jgi:hypothetical protein
MGKHFPPCTFPLPFLFLEIICINTQVINNKHFFLLKYYFLEKGNN